MDEIDLISEKALIPRLFPVDLDAPYRKSRSLIKELLSSVASVIPIIS